MARKVVAPVEVSIALQPAQRRDPAGLRRLRVAVTPRVNAPRLEVAVTLPAGITLLKGDARWTAGARAREVQWRDLVLKVPTRGERRIVATARLVAPGSLPRSRTASYTFNARVEVDRPAGALSMPLPTTTPGRSLSRPE
jgi:hypothetical protein